MIILTLLLALLLLGGRLLGLQNYIVLSGSMEPAYHTGSVVYVKAVNADRLSVGDAITFRLAGDSMATHRIVEVVGSGENIRFRTKGDANDTEDGSLIPASDVVGKVVFTIPYLGYIASFIQTGKGRAIAVAYGAFLMLMLILPELFFGEKEQSEDDNRKE